MEIVLPTKEYIDSYYELVLSSKTNNEYGELGNAAIRDNETFDEMIIRLNNRSKGINIHPRDVKSCVYWIIDNDVVVGTIDMRLELNKNYLEKFGHVAYYIKSDYRNNGYASRALHLILEKYK